jgi:hypothetical protein
VGCQGCREDRRPMQGDEKSYHLPMLVALILSRPSASPIGSKKKQMRRRFTTDRLDVQLTRAKKFKTDILIFF